MKFWFSKKRPEHDALKHAVFFYSVRSSPRKEAVRKQFCRFRYIFEPWTRGPCTVAFLFLERPTFTLDVPWTSQKKHVGAPVVLDPSTPRPVCRCFRPNRRILCRAKRTFCRKRISSNPVGDRDDKTSGLNGRSFMCPARGKRLNKTSTPRTLRGRGRRDEDGRKSVVLILFPRRWTRWFTIASSGGRRQINSNTLVSSLRSVLKISKGAIFLKFNSIGRMFFNFFFFLLSTIIAHISRSWDLALQIIDVRGHKKSSRAPDQPFINRKVEQKTNYL